MVRYWEGTANEAGQRSNISLLLKHYGEGFDVSRLDVAALDTYVFAMEKLGLANATINRRMSCLSKGLIGRILDEGGVNFDSLELFPTN
jgi:hypothetical protein